MPLSLLNNTTSSELSTEDGYAPTLIPQRYEMVLRQALASIIQQNGFSHISENVLAQILETVLEDIREMCQLLKLCTEHSSRSFSTPLDMEYVFEMLGIDWDELEDFFEEIKKRGRHLVVPPQPTDATVERPYGTHFLEISDSQKRREQRGIPSWLPPFPPPHCFRKTMINVEEGDNFVKERYQSAKTTRDNQNALKNYALLSHTGTTLCLFKKWQKDIERDLDKEANDIDDPMTGEENYDANGNAQPFDSMGIESLLTPSETMKTKLSDRIPYEYRLLDPEEEDDYAYMNALGADSAETEEDECRKTQLLAKSIWSIWRSASNGVLDPGLDKAVTESFSKIEEAE